MNKNQNNIDKTTGASAKKPVPPKKKHRRIRIKPTVGGMLSLLLLIVIVAAVVTAIVFGVKGIIRFVNEAKDTTTASTGDPDKPTVDPWDKDYIVTKHANSNLTVGDLILVNTNNPYTQKLDSTTDVRALSGYEGYNTYYVLRDYNIKVRPNIIQTLKDMIVALVDANTATLGTTLGESDQIFIADAFTALTEGSGTSEHHTGLAVNLKVFSKQTPISLRDSEYQWLKTHCAEYGFVIRYDSNKAELTGVLDEPNHLRYVGVPHATYMSEHQLCLEEYLELLRTSYKYEDGPLEITAGEKEYLVYYVEKNSAEGETFTSIPVPPSAKGSYSISGDNMNGFIVTVEKAAK